MSTNDLSRPKGQTSGAANPSTSETGLTLVTVAGGDGFLLNNQVCFALYSATLAMTKAYRPLLAEVGLTYPQYLVMLVLWEEDGLVIRDLGTRVYLDSGTLSGLLKRLEKVGFLRRERVPGDERLVRIKLTDEGRSLREPVAEVQAKVSCMTHLSVAELISLTRQISQLRDTLHCNLEP